MTQAIRERSQTCRDQFMAYLRLPTLSQYNKTLAEEQRVRFNLWAANIGVFAENHASLDHRLKHAPEIRTMSLRMLGVLERNLNRAIQVDEILFEDMELSTESPPPKLSTEPSYLFPAREDSPCSSPSNHRTPSIESLEAVTGVISQLQRLSCAIRESSILSRHSKASSYIIKNEYGNDVTSHFKQFFRNIVKSRHARVSEILCDRLADSMLLRRRSLLYLSKHQDKLSSLGQSHQEKSGGAESVELSSSADDGHSKAAKSVQQSQTTASILDQQKFHMDAKAYEGSATSSKSTFGHNKIEYPAPPTSQLPNNECTCPYCFNILSSLAIQDKKIWRRHVRKDLALYVCVFESCKQPIELFSTAKDWLKHMRWEHGLQWHCVDKTHGPLTFLTMLDFQDHLVAVHPKSFTQSEAASLATQRARPRLELFKICPLCEELPKEFAENVNCNMSDQLEEHITQHLEYLALRSLPWRDDVNMDPETSAPSSLQNIQDLPRQEQDDAEENEDFIWQDDWQDGIDTGQELNDLLSFTNEQHGLEVPSVQEHIRKDTRDPLPFQQSDESGASQSMATPSGFQSRRRKKRTVQKQSKVGPYKPAPSQPEEPIANDDEECEVESNAKPTSSSSSPPLSFLFSVNELPLNEDRSEGGLPPRHNEHRQWIPPMNSRGFGAQEVGSLYRWEDGRVTLAEDCRWLNDDWYSEAGAPLVNYRASTMFWCDNWTQFLAAPGDASLRDMEASDPGEALNHWWPLTFRHEGSLSRIEVPGDEVVLAGTGSWVSRLGLSSYTSSRRTPHSGGLAGNLAMVIALVAFSCEPRDLGAVLLEDRAWEGRRWRGHRRRARDGRTDARGVVATIYLDPANPQGSTPETITALEWSGDRLL